MMFHYQWPRINTVKIGNPCSHIPSCTVRSLYQAVIPTRVSMWRPNCGLFFWGGGWVAMIPFTQELFKPKLKIHAQVDIMMKPLFS